jgi:hypothetical protein
MGRNAVCDPPITLANEHLGRDDPMSLGGHIHLELIVPGFHLPQAIEVLLGKQVHHTKYDGPPSLFDIAKASAMIEREGEIM